jgi:hypothetical protein
MNFFAITDNNNHNINVVQNNNNVKIPKTIINTNFLV